jgi:serine acetyltransferase
MRQVVKTVLNAVFIALLFPPALLVGFGRCESGFHLFAHLCALVPGKLGEYVRRAFYCMTLERFSLDATLSFGSFFSHPSACVDDGTYIGAYCIIGHVHLGAHCQVANNVHLLSGLRQHVRDEQGRLLGAEAGAFDRIEIGAHCWIGTSVVVMADVGEGSTIGAGAVVNRPIPAGVVAVGVPAHVVGQLTAEPSVTD